MSAVSAAEVLDAAKARGWRIVTAESCTGGLVSAALTAVPGSSAVVEAGFVTYSNAAKQALLGVTAEALAQHGAVSQAVARQMAAGALRATGAELAVSVTGIAGPGGSEHKPEGRVCFAVAARDYSHAETLDFGALGRDAVRAASVDRALALLRAALG